VSVIAVGGTTARFTALTNGAIDAGLLSPPASILAEKQGLRSLAGPPDLIPYPSGGLVTSDQKLTAERAFVKSTIRAYVRGLQLIHTSRDAAVAAIRDILEIDPDTAQATYEFALGTLSRDGTTPDEAQRLLVEVEAASLELTQAPPATIGFDFGLVEEVRRELGLAGAR
jgi:ABC-type nitrate/sulfonate/bicarbonate transport system substrate-binding protein